MSTTSRIFAADLHRAFPDSVSGGPVFFRVSYASAAMDISLKPGPDRVIALMRMPTLLVQICFTEGSAAQCNAMLKRMDNYMQRGGG